MTTEVLVMCPSCARPQPPAATCIHCGAPLPDAPVPGGAARTAPLPPGQATLELGSGRQLFLSADALELRGGQDPQGPFLLAKLRRVRLEAKRPWALLAAALPLLGAATFPWWPARVVGLLGAAGFCWLFLRRRSYFLCLERVGDERLRLPLGGGPRGAVRAQTLWPALSEQLRRRGVEVEG